MKDKPMSEWSPIERRIWLASHQAPANMNLLTNEELHQLKVALVKENLAKKTLIALFTETSDVLKSYNSRANNIPDAAREVLFDAEKFRKVADEAERIIDQAITDAVVISNSTDLNTWQEEMFENLVESLGTLLKFARAQKSTKRVAVDNDSPKDDSSQAKER